MSRRLAVPGAALVSIAAAMWGLDALFRRPLTQSIAPTTIVFGEHVVLVLVTLPFLFPALKALARAGARAIVAGIVVGAGASALATILFTQAFVHGDPITPVVLQKVQPLVAVAGAWVVLGERPRKRFALVIGPALAGVWLIAFPHPLAVSANGLSSVAEALGAAALWGFGTVLGRYLCRSLRFEHVTTVRFVFGLVASAVALSITNAAGTPSAHDAVWIALLALITGALALGLYYYGLGRTPAALAAIAELAFPLTASVVGYVAFGATLQPTQWLGVGTITVLVAVLSTGGADMVRTPSRERRFEPSLA